MTLIMGGVSFIAFVIYFIGIISLHFMPTGYSPLYNTISDYSIGRFSKLARMTLAVNAVGVLLLLVAFITISPHWSGNGFLWLAILAVSRLGMVVFTTDVSGQKITAKGVAHIVLAIISFMAGVSVLGTMTRTLGTLSGWSGIYPFLKVLAKVANSILIALGITLVLPALRRIFGLVERLFLLTINLWLLTTSGLLVVKTMGKL